LAAAVDSTEVEAVVVDSTEVAAAAVVAVVADTNSKQEILKYKAGRLKRSAFVFGAVDTA